MMNMVQQMVNPKPNYDFYYYCNIPMVVLHLSTLTIQDVNPSFSRKLEYISDPILLAFSNLIYPDDFVKVTSAIEVYTPCEARILCNNGKYKWHFLSFSKDNSRTNSQCLFCIMLDIEPYRQSEEKLIQEAYCDPLTGLNNRRFLDFRLLEILERCNRRNQSCNFALFYLDINKFKSINDKYGHSIGDRLLKIVAKKLESCVRPGDIVIRQGGDEFVIVLENVDNSGIIEEVANRISTEISLPMKLGAFEINTSTSIGIVTEFHKYDTVESILHDADIAMYSAKKSNRPYVFFAK